MSEPSKSALARMNKDELVKLAAERDLDTEGTKDELVTRLAPADETLGDQEPSKSALAPADDPAMNGDGAARESEPAAQRVEEYDVTGPDGVVRVRHNIDTGATELVG